MPYIRINVNSNTKDLSLEDALQLLNSNGYSAQEVSVYDALVEEEVEYDLENFNTLDEDQITNLSEDEYALMKSYIYDKLDTNFEKMVAFEYLRYVIKQSYKAVLNKRSE